MDSRRKRKEKPLIAEDLIMSGVNQESTSYEHKTNRSNSEATEKRKHSLIFQDLDDNVRCRLISSPLDGRYYYFKTTRRKMRMHGRALASLYHYLSPLSSSFHLLSEYGWFFRNHERCPNSRVVWSPSLSAFYVPIGNRMWRLVFAPASYGITRIIQSISKSREKKQSSRLKDENFTYHQTVTV